MMNNQMMNSNPMMNNQMDNQNVINNQNMMNQNAMMNGQMNPNMMNSQNTMTQNMMNQNQNMMNNQGMMNQNGMNNQNMIYSNQMNPMYQNQNMMNNQGMMNQMYQMNMMMMQMNRIKRMEQILNASDNSNRNNINNQQPQNNINIPTDGSPNFTGMSIDGEYLREKEDAYSINEVLKAMNPNLDKNQFYIAVNARIRQLAIEIRTATRDFELKKQKNPNYNSQNEQVTIVKKMEAVRDLSRIIKFYFKEQSEKDAEQCRDYTNMDFDGLNGWIPAYIDSKGENHPGKLSFWDPISHSAIDMTEQELVNVDIPFLGHENLSANCWFNAFNSMISHIPSFYLCFLKLGKKISEKSLQEQDDIKNKFPLSYEIAMYMKRVNDLKSSGEQYYETLNFVKKVVGLLGLPQGVNDVDDYKNFMMLRLNEELGISVDKNLPDSSENINGKNSISVYNNCHSFGYAYSYSSPISKIFWTDSVSLTKCLNNHITGITHQTTGHDLKFANRKDQFGQNPKLSKLLTNFNHTEKFTEANQVDCTDCHGQLDGDHYVSAQLFSSEATLTVISIQPEKQENFKNNAWTAFSSNYPQQIKNPKQMPAFVKSGNNYFELISIGTHLDNGYGETGMFNAPHWVSYVKDVKNNQWHFCDDKNVDSNIVDSDAKHEDYITNDIKEILKKTSKNGTNYIYKKCDESKYNNAGNDIKEDISNIAFDKNGKGITKSPLYLISAKAKNYALQKDNPTNEDFKSAVGSFKNRLQDVGILDRNGRIKQDLISGNLVTEYTTGRKVTFGFSGVAAATAIVLAIKALTIVCIITAILAVVLFLLGCFYNLLKEAVESCLPGGGSGNGFDNDLEKYNQKQEFMSKNRALEGDDSYDKLNIESLL